MVNWDIKQNVKDMLDDNWSGVTPEPTFEIKDDERGKAFTPDYPIIEIQTLGDRNLEQADIFYETLDKSAYVIITLRTKNDDVEPYWQETINILLDNRTNLRGLEGGWDKISIGDNSIPDPQFADEVSNIQVKFERYNDPI